MNPDNQLDLIRAMTTHSPLCKRGAKGDLSVAGTQKFSFAPSQALPLCKRGRLVKFPNGLSGINIYLGLHHGTLYAPDEIRVQYV